MQCRHSPAYARLRLDLGNRVLIMSTQSWRSWCPHTRAVKVEAGTHDKVEVKMGSSVLQKMCGHRSGRSGWQNSVCCLLFVFLWLLVCSCTILWQARFVSQLQAIYWPTQPCGHTWIWRFEGLQCTARNLKQGLPTPFMPTPFPRSRGMDPISSCSS